MASQSLSVVNAGSADFIARVIPARLPHADPFNGRNTIPDSNRFNITAIH
jgi:hypothetical protein